MKRDENLLDAVVPIPAALRIRPSVAIILGVRIAVLEKKVNLCCVVAFLDMCLIVFWKRLTMKLKIYGCRFQTNKKIIKQTNNQV